jgi:type I restriction enzyme S subunit
MRATKDSGFDWLGEIPEGWEIKPCWSYFRRVKQTGLVGEELLSVYRDHGVVPKASRDDNHNVESEDLSSYQLVRVGDMVMNKMKAWQGSIALSDFRGIVSPAYFVYRPTHEFSRKYFHYLMRSAPYIAEYNRISKGVRIGQWDLDPTYFRTTQLIVPPPEEQRAIADFLDRETAQIDTLIAEQETLIRTLEERRGVMIREAVTVGIRGLVKMQDTEIPWVGPVCATWKIAPLKYLATTGAGAGFPIEEQGVLDEPIAFIKVNSLGRSNSEGIIQEFDDTVSIETAARLGAKVYPPETIVLAKIGAALLLGRIRQLAVESCVDNNMMAVTARMGTSARYLFYVLNLIQFERIVNPGAVPSTSESAVKNLKFPFPEFPEQIAIANYLDVETRKLDTIVETTREVVSVLQQRRRSLISAAVTGKIKVAS